MITNTIRWSAASLCGFALFALAACAAPDSNDGKAAQPQSSSSTAQKDVQKHCNADPVQYAVGQQYTPELGEKVKELSGSSVVRTLKPGQVVTMEYRFDRVSIHLDDKDIVTRVTCG